MEGNEEASAGVFLPGENEMQHKRRGSALIFNQEHFYCELNLQERQGTAADRKNLTERFQELGFKVKAYDDLPKKKMLHKLKTAARANHTDADCFVCVFLSHGDDGHVYAHDGEVNIKEVTNLFRGDNCRSLVGKPKIFIFQACRGEIGDNAVTLMSGGDEPQVEEVEEDPAKIYTLPAGADFLMCYCVTEGFTAFRSITHGSIYIQDLCETLQQQGSLLEFTELLTLVNLKVSRRTINNKKQMPCFTSMLTKKLFFRPKEE